MFPRVRSGRAVSTRAGRKRFWAWFLIPSIPLLAAGPGLVDAPLTQRANPSGPTMFATLAPEQTGVLTRNPYADPAMWEKYDREFALGSIGTGVATGDFDNDGQPDLLVIGKTEGCWLIRNLGQWKFEDVTEKAGLRDKAAGVWARGVAWATDLVGQGNGASSAEPWRQGVSFVDVDNDGWLDLYMSRFNAPNLLYINQRDGTFKEEAAARGLALTDACGMGVFCDYDRDGWLDVYVQTNMLDAIKRPNGQRGFLLTDGLRQSCEVAAGSGHYTQSSAACFFGYPDANPPRRLSVRWPDGAVTTQEVAKTSPTIIVSR